MGYPLINDYQTPFEQLLSNVPKEVADNILNAVNEYQYIRSHIAVDRPTIETAPKDDEGKVIIDFSNPHILSDMDYFRQAAATFQATGKYTDAIKSNHQKSAWAKYWKEEGLKCLTKVVNPSTGEWIPGDYYFYLNYSPIMRIVKNESGEETDRVFDFPDVYDGDYLYYHYVYAARHFKDDFIRGLHGACIKCRGRGYSFKGGSMLAKRFVLGESPKAQKKIKAFALASEKEYLTKDGILNKFIDIVVHCADNTGWYKSMIKASWNNMEWRSGYVTRDGFERGRKNEILGVSMKDNPGKARGKRANLILYEEFGKFPNFLESYRTNRPSVEAGPIAFGQCISFGTGGEEGASFTGAEELIYHPDGYRVFGIPNVYDRHATGETKSIFFSPEVFNLENAYDKDGNSDVTKALTFVMYDRWKVKYNSSDPMAITGHIAEHPISIGEAIMRRDGTLFPVVDLKEYLNEVRLLGESFFQTHYTGNLKLTNTGEVKWEISDATPLRKYSVGKGDTTGCIELFEQPKTGADGKPIKGRYICSVDPFDDDSGTSLGSMLVFDMFTDLLVAEYTARPKFANDFYENCRRLAMYFNGEILYENNKKGLFTYFSQQGSTHLLAPNPDILKDQDMMRKGNYGNKAYGYHATGDINAFGRRLQRDWMLGLAHPSLQDYDEEGEVITSKVNLQFIRSIGYIEEAIAWNPDGNFDRISAGIGLMILREEKKKYIDNIKQNNSPAKDAVNSDYFSKNYDNRWKKTYSHKELEDYTRRYFPVK